MMLLSLPGELSLHILSELLEVVDISRLDVACMSRASRRPLLDLLSKSVILHVGTRLRTGGLTRGFIEYVALRGLCLPFLKIHPTVCDTDILLLEGTGVAGACTSLSIESCKCITTIGAQRLISWCSSSVEFLNLAWSRTDDDCIRAVAESCRGLLALQVISCDISDSSIVALAQGCRHLAELNLTYCVRITDKAIGEIGRFLTSSLRTLSLSGCKRVTDASLISLSGCHRLQSVDLNGCMLITDIGLTSLVTRAVLIDTLRINDCINLTDASAVAVADSLAYLTVIGIQGLHHVTDIGIIRIAQAYKTRLKRVDIYGCSYTEVGIAELNLLCPQLPPLWL